VIEEIWKPVKGYEEFYMVSNKGQVMSLRKKTRISDKGNQIMKQKDDGKGYLRVNITDGKKPKAMLVSRMVAEAFISNPDNLPQVGHMDDVKTNNTTENLYWTDSRENNHHNGKMERFHCRHKEKISQIAEALSKPVISTDLNTGEELYFKSIQEAARMTNAKSEKISMCCNGLRKHHQNKSWRFANNENAERR